MKDRTKIRTGKRIMAVLLSFVMVFGIFSGMKLDAEAREGKVYQFENLTNGMVLYAGDIIEIKADILKIKDTSKNIEIEIEERRQVPLSKDRYRYILPIHTQNGESYNTYCINLKPNQSILDVGHPLGTTIPVSLSVTTFEKENAETPAPVTSESHTCNFQWVTTIDPTTGADGLEEYKCVGCGAVQESHPIPASVAKVKDFYGKVKDAPANGTVNYDSGKLYTISDYLLKKMSERSDVAVTVNFEYQNAKYELTFPAGTDYTPVLTDEETMYGYFGVAAKLGLTVVAK